MHSVNSLPLTIRILNRTYRVNRTAPHHLNFHHIQEGIKPHFGSLRRIICTSSRLDGAVSHKIQTIHGNESDQDTLCFPVSLYKENSRCIDQFYITQTAVLKDSHSIQEFISTKKFKDVLARSSFSYDVNLAETRHDCPPFASIYFYSFEDVHSSSMRPPKNKVTTGETQQVFIGESSDAKENNTGRPTEEQLLQVIDRLTIALINFFEKPQDYGIYHKNIIFQNNIRGVTIKGLSAYMQAMSFLKIYGIVQYAKVKVEILKITHHIEDGTVRVRWRVKGVSRHKILLKLLKFKSMSWPQFSHEESDWLDGFSVFSVGPDGLIHKHMCDKMTPSDEPVAKPADLKSRLLGLFELGPRGPAAGSLNALIPCYRQHEFSTCKKLT